MRPDRVILSFFLVIVASGLLSLYGCGSPSAGTGTETHTAHASTSRAEPSQIPSTSQPTITPATDPTKNPARLLIPSIDVNAPVEALGIQANGDMATPTRNPWADVGWYNGGPRPGEPGSAVIDGHLDRPGGYPAVFWNLRFVHVGDLLQVLNAGGKRLHFRVTAVEFYTPQAAPIQEIFGNRNGTYLNLITCAGDWIPQQQQTTLRLVIYTTLFSS